MTVLCQESDRRDADRVCAMIVGMSPSACPPCARGEPFGDSSTPPKPASPPSGVVWVGPRVFTTVQMVRFHVKLHHGLWLGDIPTLKRAVIEHAAMHGQFPEKMSALHSERAELLKSGALNGGPTVIPHIHEDVSEWSVLRMLTR